MLELKLSKKNGGIKRLSGDIKTYAEDISGHVPLFRLRLMTGEGKFIAADSLGADEFTTIDDGNIETIGGHVTLNYGGYTGELSGLKVTAEIRRTDDDSIAWGLTVDNNTDYIVESVDYPCVTVPDGLSDASEDGFRLFRAFAEGCEMVKVPDADPNTELMKLDSDGDLYPCLVSMQYLAYYNGNTGLYFAAHDIAGTPKTIRTYRLPTGEIRLSIRTYHAIEAHSVKSAGFDMVTAQTGGGWYGSAERYRTFLETSGFPLPKKLYNEKNLPEWYGSSPVVVIYPPRSVRGTGYYGPNEFYPYENGIKYMDELSEEFSSPVLAFLTYWEGSAPWAPPFIWPPYGDIESFRHFVELMHKRGNMVGLYGSGLNWTDKSLLTPEYDKTEYRLQNDIDASLCRKPNGDFYNGICTTIRTGYRMCPSCGATREIALDQTRGILSSEVDFLQLFDQDMGGFGCPCYEGKHGHVPSLGAWETKAIKSLHSELTSVAEQTGTGKCLYGTESCAADIFISGLRFNDLRYNLNASRGRAVPAYEYVTHEYLTNFMGNQCEYDKSVPHETNPDSFLFRLAYSAAAGDMLTISMKSGGEIHWEWGMSWLIPGPNRSDTIACVKNFNALRSGCAKRYLTGGRMEKPYPVSVEGEPFTLHLADGRKQLHSYVQYSLWKANDGRRAQVLFNFSRECKTVSFGGKAESVSTHDTTLPFEYSQGETRFTIPPFTAVCVFLLS